MGFLKTHRPQHLMPYNCLFFLSCLSGPLGESGDEAGGEDRDEARGGDDAAHPSAAQPQVLTRVGSDATCTGDSPLKKSAKELSIFTGISRYACPSGC